MFACVIVRVKSVGSGHMSRSL